MDPSCEVIDSTPSPAGLAALLRSQYGLEGALPCELIQQNLDATYKVSTTHGPYAARVYNASWWSEAEVAYEMAVLSHLASKGVRVPKPLTTSSGKAVTTLQAPEGLRQLTVVEYLCGRAFVPASDAREYGALVARVHSEMADFATALAKRGPTLDNLIEDAFAPVLEQAPAGGKLCERFARLKERIQRRIDEHVPIPKGRWEPM